MRVVVTGGAGFIGCNLVRRLRADDHDVVVVDDFSTGFKANLAGVDGIELYEATILDGAALDRAFAGADSVVHLAARGSVPRSVDNPVASHESNTTGTLSVLESVRRCPTPPHVIVASSSSVYGDNAVLPRREDLVLAPVSPYAATKVATEAYARAWAAVYGLDVLTFRFFNVFGPFQAAGHAYAAVVPVFISAAVEGRPLPLHGDGMQARDFTYVECVCSVLAEAVDRRVTSEGPVNLAFGRRQSLLQLIAELENAIGRSLDLELQPPRRGDVHDSEADTTRLRELFPGAAPIAFADAVARTVEWYSAMTVQPTAR